jgi:hypothetical protein
MKTFVSLLVGVLVLFGSACGSSPDPTATPDATPESALAATATAPAATATAQPTTPAATPTATPPAPTATPAATSTPRPVAPPTPTATATIATTGDVETELARVAETVAEIRGLELLEHPPVTIATLDELQAYLLALLEEEYSVEEGQQDALALWLLQLIDDPNLDMFQMWVDVYQTGTAGLYNPQTKEILTLGAGEGLTAYAEIVMAHEYTHALQDQHWGFDRLQPDDLDAEASLAMQALTEGDAEVVRTLYMINHMSRQRIQEAILSEADQAETPAYIPSYVLEVMAFPYLQGGEFVAALYQRGGFDAVNAAYDDPPLSTEQILHPEKYYGPERDDPVAVELPDFTSALGDGWSEIDNDVIGELELRIMLRNNGAPTPELAAAGWGGGRYAFYMHDGSGLIVNRIAWDTPEDLTQFEDAFRATLSGMQEEGGIFTDDAGRYHALVEYEGTSVFLAANDRAALQRALATLIG